MKTEHTTAESFQVSEIHSLRSPIPLLIQRAAPGAIEDIEPELSLRIAKDVQSRMHTESD